MAGNEQLLPPPRGPAAVVARAAPLAGASARLPAVSGVEARFLAVWYACVAADWLQGPYLFALYKDRGCSKRVIARLFAVGFVSSGALGSFVGGLCDRIGQRRGCLLYCALALTSCLLTHSTSVAPLALGRVVGGVAESLLYSAFEARAIAEHRRVEALGAGACAGAPLSRLLARMWLGSWIVAILAGVVSSSLVHRSPSRRWDFRGPSWAECRGGLAYGGPTAPFDLAALCCLVGATLILLLWRDAGPDVHQARGPAAVQAKLCRPGTWRAAVFEFRALRWRALLRTWAAAASDRRILWCGAIIAAFEGSMFVFVFSWSPVLVAGRPDLAVNLGFVFSAFMMCCAGGSTMFEAMCQHTTPAQLLPPLLLAASVSLLIAAVASQTGPAGFPAALAGFLAFEFCIGVYFPCVSALKSDCVPERMRSLIYSLYRVPLNVLALAVLLGIPSSGMALAICSGALSAAAAVAGKFSTQRA